MNNALPTVGEMLVPLDQYPHLRDDEPIGNGVAQLLQHCSADGRHLHFDEMLVINGENHLVGRLTVQDILVSFFPSILERRDAGTYIGKQERFSDLAILLEGSFRNECRRQATTTVRQYMKSVHRSIDTAMHPLHALEIMVADRHLTLPVTENKVLLGAVRMNDIFRILGSYCTI